MKGTRPLDNSEIRLVSACFEGTYAVRNRGLFMLGVSTGGHLQQDDTTESLSEHLFLFPWIKIGISFSICDSDVIHLKFFPDLEMKIAGNIKSLKGVRNPHQ